MLQEECRRGGEFLQFVINDPWSVWLRPVSGMDELREPAQEAKEEEALSTLG